MKERMSKKESKMNEKELFEYKDSIICAGRHSVVS
jgi:hypothetical protein